VADALHTPGVTSAAEARLDDAGLIAVQGPTALDARTGVLIGPGTTTLVTGTADTAPMAYLIAPHHWVTNRGVNTDGVYRGTLEAATRVTTTAAPGSGSRIDVIYAKQGDANSTISPDGSTAPIYGCAQGNSTTGTPVAPSIPVGAIELARATVSAGATATNGAGVVISQTARQTAARGAAIPVRSQTERDALTTRLGLRVLRLDRNGAEEWHDGTRWRYEGDYVIAATAAEQNALAAYVGLSVYRTDLAAVQVCTATGPTTWATVYSDSGWKDLTVNSPFTGTAKYRIRNGGVDWYISLTRTTAWTGPLTVLTFPAEAIPTAERLESARIVSTNAAGVFVVAPSGSGSTNLSGAANNVIEASGFHLLG
jgi:hypothetical protein